MMRALLGLAILLPACAAPPAPAPTEPVALAIAAARADAARRTGRKAQFPVQKVESVTWPDGGLGCPKKGMAYTQALVPGYRVQLRVGREVWDYHASERGGVVLCPAGQSQQPAPSGRN